MMGKTGKCIPRQESSQKRRNSDIDLNDQTQLNDGFKKPRRSGSEMFGPMRSASEINMSKSLDHATKGGRGVEFHVNLNLDLGWADKLEKKSKNKLPYCKWAGCSKYSNSIKKHTENTHLPALLSSELDPVSEFLTAKRVDAMLILGKWIKGGMDGDCLDHAFRFMKRSEWFQDSGCNAMVTEWYVRAMTAICNYLKLKIPKEGFLLYPFNSPACLIHWRSLVALLNNVKPEQRKIFKERFGSIEVKPVHKQNKPLQTTNQEPCSNSLFPLSVLKISEKMVPDVEEDILGMVSGNRKVIQDMVQHNIKEAQGMAPENRKDIQDTCSVLVNLDDVQCKIPENEEDIGDEVTEEVYTITKDEIKTLVKTYCIDSIETPCIYPPFIVFGDWLPIPNAIDCHVHLDSTSYRLSGNHGPKRDLDEILYAEHNLKPCSMVKLKGVVAAYCDPNAMPASFPSDTRVKVAIGVHPSKIQYFTEEKKKWFKEIKNHPQVTALGEFGFDLTLPADTWDAQLKFLHEIFPLCQFCKPVILCIRGNKESNINPYEKVFEIAVDYFGRAKPIHLQGFNGTPQDFKVWSGHFKNCYFGFDASVASFSDNQVEGLQCVPFGKITLGTGSPSFSCSGKSHKSTLDCIGDVGRVAADKIGLRYEFFMFRAFENAKRLYFIPFKFNANCELC